MKHQRIALRLVVFATVFHADELTGRKEDQGAFLVVVVLFAVAEIPAYHVLQEDRIKPVAHTGKLARRRFRQVDHAHQRMQRLMVVERVVLADRIKSYYSHMNYFTRQR